MLIIKTNLFKTDTIFEAGANNVIVNNKPKFIYLGVKTFLFVHIMIKITFHKINSW